MTNPEAKSPPAGELTDDISEQLDLLVACAKPASGKNSARVAAGLVRDYIADLIQERDEARTAQSSPPAGEIQGLVERAMALANAATDGPWTVRPVDPMVVRRGYAGETSIAHPEGIVNARVPDAAFIAASRQLIPELCEAITRLSQPEEIREAAAKIAEDFQWLLPTYSGRKENEASDDAAETVKAQIAHTIRRMPLPLSSGSNKSDDGKKGQPG